MDPLILGLIDEVKKHPYLYDPSRDDYRNSHKKDKCWRKIGRILDENPEALKREWIKLTAYYLSGLGSEIPRKEKPIEKYMSFLEPFAYELSARLHANSEEEQNFQLEDAFLTQGYLDDTEFDFCNVSNQEYIPSEKTNRGSKHIEDENQEKKTEVTDNESECDDLQLFFKSVYQTTKRLPRLQQIKIKDQIMRLICENETQLLMQPLNPI